MNYFEAKGSKSNLQRKHSVSLFKQAQSAKDKLNKIFVEKEKDKHQKQNQEKSKHVSMLLYNN